MKQLFTLLVVAVMFTLTACNHAQRPNGNRSEGPLHAFSVPTPPTAFERAQQLDYLCRHYWDRFRFDDTLALRTLDSMQLLRRYGQFAALAAQQPFERAPMDTLMRRAAASRPMFELFVWLADEVLHDPNSPLRNDELYIPVLEAQLAAPWYDEYDRIGPAYALRMAQQNRLGRRANDLRYTTADGRTGTLHAIEAEFTLLFFNNPDCTMCKSLREQITASPRLAQLLAEGRLVILALYPDEDLAAWHRYRSEIPSSWINAYDAGCVIRETESYAVNAIPSLYLLDRSKRVLVKDSTEVGEIEAATAQ